jgi:hypothetical protein
MDNYTGLATIFILLPSRLSSNGEYFSRLLGLGPTHKLLLGESILSKYDNLTGIFDISTKRITVEFTKKY